MSADRLLRFQAIGEHLAGQEYDIVCLQEVWCEADYREVCKLAGAKLPHSHYFRAGTIGSGTVVFSKVPILQAVFTEFSQNGLPHRVWHGDWWAGKGLGLCVLQLRGLTVQVFVSHLHAEYRRVGDIYLGHRLVQALQAAQWVGLAGSGADLILYAGDLNTEPSDAPYWLLRTVGELKDSWEEAGTGPGETCNTEYSSYREPGHAKRIDYILYRAGPGRAAWVERAELPLPRRVPGGQVSYSDHEAVCAVVVVEPRQMEAEKTAEAAEMRYKAVVRAGGLVETALAATSQAELLYSALTLLLLALLAAGPSLPLPAQLLLTLAAGYTAAMATLFSRRERNALTETRDELSLLQSRSNIREIE